MASQLLACQQRLPRTITPRMASTMDLDTASQSVAEQLRDRDQRLVLAESCTAGLIASSLAAVPGISAYLAGSMVVYQEASKMKWLGVDEETLAQHTAVSAPVAHQMVTGALHATPHADLAAAVTGHLGPDAPEGFDGLIFVAICRRGGQPKIYQEQLKKTKRVARQREAATTVLAHLLQALSR
ncbi:nicotinamide-nucleotide amidohydrolase family protein [Planctomycetes bacterium SV_7m_r]